jgi:SRSO17 transposase
MRETTPAAMPPCFDKWCKRFDDLLRTKAQKREFRHYLGGLLGESERKNVSQMARDAVKVTYHKLHHFLTEATWSALKINERRLELIARSLNRGYRPGIVLIDSAYGNNTSFLKELEKKELKYIGGIAKNRNILFKTPSGKSEPIRIDEYAKWISEEEFKEIQIQGEKPRTVWVAIIEVEISKLIGQRKIAIVMSAPVFEDAEDIDYLITNVEGEVVTEQWIVDTYSQRNWVEVFYREAKGWLGLSEYQVREKRGLERHFILVFCAYTFILWHKLTGGLRRRWANKPLNTFPEALEAFRTAMSFRFVRWLNQNLDLFTAYKASLGFVWA